MDRTDILNLPSPPTKEWKAIVKDFAKPRMGMAAWQLVNSVGAYVALWVGMFFLLKIESNWKWGIILPVALLAGALVVRIFIIFHDCGHGSFFKNKKYNNFWGFITGTLAFTPYMHWRWEHSVHHAHNGHLGRRGVGDIWTMTVDEYLNSTPRSRFFYRLGRNPLVLFLIGPMYTFMIRHRFPLAKAKRSDKISVLYSNLAIAAMIFSLCLLFGWKEYLFITFIVMTVASTTGVWLFYVQHQFEDTYWETEENWDYFKAAVYGSSFYKLPKVFQWFSGNIGFHHIHHLSSKIPNYNLERCHKSHEMFNSVKPLTFWKSLKCINYRLWDAENMKLITFSQLRNKLKDSQGLNA